MSMNIVITYDEFSAFAGNGFKGELDLAQVDGKTLAVRYKPGRILPALEVGLHVDAVHEEEVELSYNCSVAMGLLIAGAVAYLQERIPSGVDVDTARKYIRVDLGGVEQLKKFVTKMSLTDITFEKEAVNVELKLR